MKTIITLTKTLAGKKFTRIHSTSLSVLTLFFGLTGFAAGPMDRADRIKNDPVLSSIVEGVQSKYQVQCNMDQSQIAWRCLNGPGCGYTLSIDCIQSNHIGGWQIAASGFDDGNHNDLSSVEFRRLK